MTCLSGALGERPPSGGNLTTPSSRAPGLWFGAGAPPVVAWFVYALFLGVVPLVAHWRYSHLGFNPTDDGFFLAASRRLLDGQIPHRDFITIRPAGSAILHLPELMFGGDHVFLISRYIVWVQFAWIALAWTRLTGRLIGAGRDPAAEAMMAAIGFTFSSHFFPPMAWATIDSLFLASTGLLLCQRRTGLACGAGYVLLGMAVLCKQNFVFLAMAALLLGQDRRRIAAWAAVALPGLGYGAVLAASGGVSDAFVQLTTQTDLLTPGFLRYLWESGTAWGVTWGYLATRFLYRPRGVGSSAAGPRALAHIDVAVAGFSILAAIGVASDAMAEGRFLNAPSFGLFGLAFGALLSFVVDGEKPSALHAHARAGAYTVAAAWCASISIGYNTPALASGLCVIYLLRLVRASPSAPGGLAVAPRHMLVLGVAAAVALVNFNTARERFVYLDRDSAKLTFALDGWLPGGAGLMTNENTQSFLRDLDDAIGRAGGRYAILPDLAGYWVEARQSNPLPTDWPQWIELGRPELLARVIADVEARRGSLTFIVQKVQAASLARDFVPLLDGDRYRVVAHVREHFSKVGETRFFDLYR